MNSVCDSSCFNREEYLAVESLPKDGSGFGLWSRWNRSRALRGAALLASALVVTLGSGGCRLCCDSEDVAFPTYGGAWERTHRDDGRVGSLFEPGGARSSSLSARDSSEDSARGRIAPFAQPADGDVDPSLKHTDPVPRSKEEREKKFEERRDRVKEKMLSAEVIPGEPSPPAYR